MVHMRSVQVSKANGPFDIVERDIPEPSDKQVLIRYKHVAYAIVIRLLKKDYSQASIIQGFLAMRLQGL
jgi:NADPH-dependent curcumin reductase CurA